jgi:hypothetical protein
MREMVIQEGDESGSRGHEMFRKKPKTENVEAESKNEKPDAAPPKIKFIGEFTTHQGRELPKLLTDIDVSDPEEIKVLYKGEWRPLEKYRTQVVIELSDLTFRGGWYSRMVRGVYDRNWHEALEGSVHINLGYSDRLYSFFDRENWIGQSSTDARYSVYEARFDETSIAINPDFEKQEIAKEEERSFEDRYIGSPVKYFPSAQAANEFIDFEIMPFSGETILYEEQIAQRAGRPKQYHWPDIVLTNMHRFQADNVPHGFYGPSIRVPEDVYQGLRRSIADFRQGLRISVVADIELLGIDILNPYPAPGHPIADFSIVPRAAQITGRIEEVNVRWGDEEPPFNNPSSIWKNPDQL